MVFMCPELSDLSTTLLQEWQGLYCFTRWSEASVIRPKHAFCSKEERGMERYLWPFFFSQPQKATYGTFPMLFKWKTPSVLTFFPDTPEIFPLMTLVKLCFTRISAPWYQEPVNKKGWLASLPYTELCGSGMCQVFFGLMTGFFFFSYIQGSHLDLHDPGTLVFKYGYPLWSHDIWESAKSMSNRMC